MTDKIRKGVGVRVTEKWVGGGEELEYEDVNDYWEKR